MSAHRFGRVLWEDESRAGTQLLEQAAAFYARGVQITEADRAKYKQYLIHKVAGMEDDIATPPAGVGLAIMPRSAATRWREANVLALAAAQPLAFAALMRMRRSIG